MVGLRVLVLAAAAAAMTVAASGAGVARPPAGGRVVFDGRATFAPWPSIDDAVMGGVSSSALVSGDGFASFRGVVSLANRGGFASVRSRPLSLDLGAFEGLRVAVRGDGRRYGLRLRTTDAFDSPSYQHALQPPAGEWVSVDLPFTGFEVVYRGRPVDGWPPLDPAAIRTMGWIIADGQAGAFRLDVAWIAAVAEAMPEGKPGT